MMIEAVLAAIMCPYIINLDTLDQDLQELYDKVSNTTDPILSLDIVKKNFDISNYQVNTHMEKLDDVPDSIKLISENEYKRILERYGKQYIKLQREDIKQLFSVDQWREQQLNKLI